jgi:hypothetical protein
MAVFFESRRRLSGLVFHYSVALISALAIATPASAAITWDSLSQTSGGQPAGSGTQWWFDPLNWSAQNSASTPPYHLPPTNDGSAVTDTQINVGSVPLPGGEGVVYDPSNDPNFAAAQGLTYPAGYGPQSINQLYISRSNATTASDPTNMLTIKGDLTVQGAMIVGRSSGTRGVATNGIVVQKSGTLQVTLNSLDLGQTDTGSGGLGYGNGTFDYRGGTLEVSQQGGSGLRLSVGTNSAASDGLPAGAAGVGKFTMHNPTTGGHVRPFDMVFAAYAGPNDSMVTDADPNGVTTGVGIAEFHYENGGVRPIQVSRNLSLNNGQDPNTLGTRSARLDLKLDAPVTLGAGGVPINLGLFDVDFDQTDLAVGAITGTGNKSKIFSNVANTADYTEGSTVTATFGGTTYNWTITYTGNITWSDAANSVVQSITGPGTGTDVVLVGLSSVSASNADFDGNGLVDGKDFLLWQRSHGGAGNHSQGDANSDGQVNAADLTIWKSQFGTSPSVGAVGAVPEPSSIIIAFGMLLGAGASRRLRQRVAGQRSSQQA